MRLYENEQQATKRVNLGYGVGGASLKAGFIELNSFDVSGAAFIFWRVVSVLSDTPTHLSGMCAVKQ